MADGGFSALGNTFATRNPGAGEDFTDLAAAVQLRLRVAMPFILLTVRVSFFRC